MPVNRAEFEQLNEIEARAMLKNEHQLPQDFAEQFAHAMEILAGDQIIFVRLPRCRRLMMADSHTT
jgi:hypothetical protein